MHPEIAAVFSVHVQPFPNLIRNNLIPLFPAIKFEIKSSAKPAEIAALLSTQVKPYATYTRGDEHKTFTGSVSESGFLIVLARKKF